MNVKKYIAKDMQEAMSLIRAELGSDAVILSNQLVRKKGLAGLFSKKVMEVVVAYEQAAPAPAKSNQQKTRPPLPKTTQHDVHKPPTSTKINLRTQEDAARAFAALSPEPSKPKKQPEQELAKGSASSVHTQPAVFPTFSSKEITGGKLTPAALTPATTPIVQTPSTQSVPNITQTTQTPQILPVAQTPAQPVQPAQQMTAPLDGKLDVLDARISALGDMIGMLTQNMQAGQDLRLSPAVLALQEKLLNQEVLPDLTKRLCQSVQDMVDHKGISPHDAMLELLQWELGPCAQISITPGKQKVVLLVGPTGVGKTTTLVKLAALHAYTHNVKVGLINTDTYRIAANEQLKTYAEILQTPMGVAYNAQELSGELQKMEDCDLILIDTPGKSPTDATHKEQIKEMLSELGGADVLLVLPAGVSAKASEAIIKNYAFLRTHTLVVTKSDEVAAMGAVLNACVLSGRPLSYITCGQNVPDDLLIADAHSVALQLIS